MNECCILATKLVFASIYVSWDNFLKKLKNIEQFSSIHINAMVNPQAPPETAATTTTAQTLERIAGSLRNRRKGYEWKAKGYGDGRQNTSAVWGLGRYEEGNGF